MEKKYVVNLYTGQVYEVDNYDWLQWGGWAISNKEEYEAWKKLSGL